MRPFYVTSILRQRMSKFHHNLITSRMGQQFLVIHRFCVVIKRRDKFHLLLVLIAIPIIHQAIECRLKGHRCDRMWIWSDQLWLVVRSQPEFYTIIIAMWWDWICVFTFWSFYGRIKIIYYSLTFTVHFLWITLLIFRQFYYD